MALSPEDTAAWGATDPAALGFIRAYCGWHIAPVRTEVVAPRGATGHLFTLPTLALVELVALTVDGEPQDLAPPATGLPLLQSGVASVYWPGACSRRLGGVQAEIRHGLAEAPAELVALARQLKTVLEVGVGGVRVGNISLTPAAVSAATAGLPPFMLTVLDNYRLPPLS